MDETADIRQYWDVIKRRKLQILVPAVLVFCLCVVIAVVWPPVYKSSATILIEAQEIPQDFVRTTVTGYVEERLQMITQIVLSRNRLLEIINRLQLYEDLKGRFTTEEIIEEMREDIQMETIQAEVVNPQSGRPGSATVAFTLSYEGKNPRKVGEVANVLASLYLEENLKNREEKARTTFEFLETQLEALRSDIVRTEAQIAEFKDKHINELPELMQLNLQTMDRLQREIDAKEEQIKTLTNRKIYLEGQLAAIEPMMYTVSLEGKRLMTPKEEVQTLQSQYMSLRATLSDGHPDVVNLKKRLDAMETEVATREDLRERYRQLHNKETELALISKKFSDKHPDMIKLKKEVAKLKDEVQALSEKQTVLKASNEKPENPSYINLQTQIASTQLDVENARRELSLLKEKYEDYQRRVENTPQVEQQYRALERDYTNAQAKYQETMNRLLAAKEAKGLEESRMGEKFTLVDPAVMPEKPDRPNRLAILLIGLVLAAGAGIGVGSAAEYTDQSVYRADELAKVAGYPVLAMIPYLATPQDLVRQRLKRWAFAGGTVGIVIAGLAALHYFYRPLDILWIKLIRELYISF
jgi:uncharacterized protein involved in exopolysaccharide biosynthesis